MLERDFSLRRGVVMQAWGGCLIVLNNGCGEANFDVRSRSHPDDLSPQDAGAGQSDPDAGIDGYDASSPSEAAAPARCTRLELLDRLDLGFSADGCPHRSPRVVATNSGFEAIAHETQVCSDGVRRVHSISLGVDNERIVAGEPIALMETEERSVQAAYFGGTLAVCSGVEGVIRNADGNVERMSLAPNPCTPDECSATYRCNALAGAKDGWLAGLEWSRDGQSSWEFTIYNPRGVLAAGPQAVTAPITGAIEYREGFAWVAAGYGTDDTSLARLKPGERTPTVHRLSVDGIRADLSEWAFDNGNLAAVIAGEVTAEGLVLDLVVLDDEGQETLRSSFTPFQDSNILGFGGPRARIDNLGGAAIVATRVEWEGNADQGLLSVVLLGADGTPLHEPFVDPGRAALFDLAVSGRYALLHQSKDLQTEALLFGCE